MIVRIIITFISFLALSLAIPTFDPKLAEDIYSYSQPAYCPIDIINEWSCTPCQKHFL